MSLRKQLTDGNCKIYRMSKKTKYKKNTIQSIIIIRVIMSKMTHGIRKLRVMPSVSYIVFLTNFELQGAVEMYVKRGVGYLKETQLPLREHPRISRECCKFSCQWVRAKTY